MGAMHEFLLFMETPEAKALYAGLDETWNARAAEINARLADKGVPLRVANMSTVWTILYTRPSRYNWMLQYYLRREGLALSWVGTGRLIFSLNYTPEDFEEVAVRFVTAGEAMARDGWWWEPDKAQAPRTTIKRQILKEILSHRFPWLAGGQRLPSA
jgi:glutamate-1-semialdehyde 2,1-aminomutase